MSRSNCSLLWLCLAVAVVLLAKSPALAQKTNAFNLASGERVALIGDALIDDDAAHGFLEYFFVTQRPGRAIDVRNLAWLLAAPGTNATATFRVTTNSLATLRQRLDAFRPTIAVVGFGLTTGVPEVAEVTNAVERVLATIQESADTNPVRLVMLSPMRREQVAPPLDLAAVNRRLLHAVFAVEPLAVRRGGRFVNLFERLKNDRMIPPPPLTGADGHLKSIGIDECQVLATGTEVEACGQRHARHNPVLAGGKDDQLRACAEIRRRKPPFGQPGGVVREEPAVEIHWGAAGVEDLDPVRERPILIGEGGIVRRHELGDQQMVRGESRCTKAGKAKKGRQPQREAGFVFL